MTEALKELAAHIADRQPDAVIGHSIAHGELTVEVALAEIDSFVEFLKADRACSFSTLIDITGVDWPERERRFDVVYHFLSMYQNHRIRVKVCGQGRRHRAVHHRNVHPSCRLVRARGLRHVRVLFSGNTDLRRILTDYGFRGIRCARISRPRAIPRCATTKS
jgi:NADH-quinone oxidoreductase subunit C